MFSGCAKGQKHVAHEVCIAKEMASLKIINLSCTICNSYSQPTIHDTNCDGADFENFGVPEF